MSETASAKLHVAMIMDGNRRFAKRLMKEPWNGHEYGAKKLENVLKWCKEAGVRALTVFAFSLQNFNRPKREFDFLMKLFKKFFGEMKERESEVNKEDIRIKFHGRRQMFPEDIQQIISEAEEMTKDNGAYDLNICFGYGGREEIVDASKKLAEDVKAGKVSPEEVSEEMLDSYMYMNDKPDIIIRTGGDHRTSNFLSWQSAYSEWFFVDKMWPEFEKEDFQAVLDDFKSRDRRFGK